MLKYHMRSMSEQWVFMDDTYIKCGSARKARKRFRLKVQDITVPHIKDVHRIVKK
jgi:hypothetical protein